MDSKYPEHEKVSRRRPYCEAVSGFLEWLGENGYHIAREHQHTKECYDGTCGYDQGELVADFVPGNDALIAAAIDVDEQAFSKEKDQMLTDLREAGCN